VSRDAFGLKIQNRLCHLKWARKVLGLSRNGPLVCVLLSLLDLDFFPTRWIRFSTKYYCITCCFNEYSFESIPWTFLIDTLHIWTKFLPFGYNVCIGKPWVMFSSPILAWNFFSWFTLHNCINCSFPCNCLSNIIQITPFLNQVSF